MIKVNSLRVDYEGVTAVRDLSLDIAPGQVYGLVGPNGAGKTSTLKALSGIIAPTYGEIHLNGVDLELNSKEALKQVGFMPDFSPVYENLRVCEYLEVFAAAYFCPRSLRLECARHWVERVSLTDKWEAFIHTLSRGMRQRLVLAKTLLSDPKVVLLDEPASGLDPIGRIEMRNILKSLASSGKAVVISSHILTELSDICNAVGIMQKGTMVVSGSIEDIRARIGMMSELLVRISAADEPARQACLTALNSSPFLKDVTEPSQGEFRAVFCGHDAEATEVLALLVKAGVSVSEFRVHKADVEDIFLKIGARETS